MFVPFRKKLDIAWIRRFIGLVRAVGNPFQTGVVGKLFDCFINDANITRSICWNLKKNKNLSILQKYM